MMIGRQHKPDLYVTRILRRRMAELSDLRQQELADALDVERSHISRQLSGDFRLRADELDVWCDHLDTIEPLQAIARRLGYEVVPQARDAQPVSIRRGFFALMRATGTVCSEADEAMEDGSIEPAEAERMRARLQGLVDTCQDLMARLPAPRATGPTRRRSRQ